MSGQIDGTGNVGKAARHAGGTNKQNTGNSAKQKDQWGEGAEKIYAPFGKFINFTATFYFNAEYEKHKEALIKSIYDIKKKNYKVKAQKIADCIFEMRSYKKPRGMVDYTAHYKFLLRVINDVFQTYPRNPVVKEVKNILVKQYKMNSKDIGF